jgi:hypothetical protein
VTTMLDCVRFEAPLGGLGKLANRYVIRRHLERFLAARNEAIRSVAESSGRWQQYLSA